MLSFVAKYLKLEDNTLCENKTDEQIFHILLYMKIQTNLKKINLDIE